MKKKMNPTAFWLLACSYTVSILVSIISFIIALRVDTSELFAEFIETFNMELKPLEDLYFGMLTSIFVIGMSLNGYFLYRIIKNKIKATKQVYLTVIFVLNIIGLVFNTISLLTGDILAIVSIAFNICIIVGRVIQKKYNPTEPISNQEIDPFV